MAHRTVWGLDIGNSAIKAIKMVRSGAEARVVDFDIIDIQGDDEEANRQGRVKAALSTLCSHHNFGRDAVYLSMPGDMSLFREFQLPPGSESKLNDLVMYEAKQQIPFPLDQVEMGWERYDDPSGVGVEMIVVRKNIIQDILTLTDGFKLNVQGITVAPIAIFNFIHYEFSPQGPTLLLDAGYKSTDFVVMDGRHMYSRTIQIAGREITRVLENKFKVSFEKAEELKKNIGQSKQADKILSVIEPTLRQLGAEIQRTIGFYKSKARGQKIAQAYLLGHTFRLPRMAETMASQVREAPFTIVDGVKRIVLDRAVNPGVFSNEFPTMAVAIGLGLQGLGLSELSVNLLPKDRIVEIKIGQQQIWSLLSAAAILVALGVNYVQEAQERDYFKGLQGQIVAATKEVKEQKALVEKSVKVLPAEKARVEALARVGRDRGRMLQIFTKVAGVTDEAGKPFFGSDTQKVFLTGLYVSRAPFALEQGVLPSSGVFGASRGELAKRPNFQALYAPLKGAAQGAQLDLPLLVILSGECENDQTIRSLEKALKKNQPDLDVRTEYTSVTREEWVPSLDWDGKHLSTRGAAAVTKYTAFHLMFRWKPEAEDKDWEPPEVAAASAR